MKRTIEDISFRTLVLGFIFFNFVVKAALIRLNLAEYTDGILQITLLQHLNSIYPPLYAVLVNIINVVTRDLEMAGRIVSVVASSLTVWPLLIISDRLYGRRAAVFAAIFYTISPIPMRWAIHAMTDATFGLLFCFAILFFIKAWMAAGNAGESAEAGGNPAKSAALGVLFAVLAMLTRYQGILLGPVGFFFIVYLWKSSRRPPLILILTHVLWFAPVAWAMYAGFIHLEQFGERGLMAGSPQMAALNYWFHFESWLMYLPFFFTPLLFILIVAGWFVPGEGRRGCTFYLSLALYLTAVIIVLQTFFSSFQSRYLLPALIALLPFAGRTAAWLEERARLRPAAAWLQNAIVMAAILYALGFSLASITLQREAFGDIKQISRMAGEANITGTIYTNEVYREGMAGIKCSFWSGKPAILYTGQELKDGDVYIWSSAYGGLSNYNKVMAGMMQENKFYPVLEASSKIVPLLPDIMAQPVSQNPIALSQRYQQQLFITVLYAKSADAFAQVDE